MDRTKDHKLINISVVAICAVICEAEGWMDIENFGNSKLPWLKTILELPNGIPSHDILMRTIAKSAKIRHLKALRFFAYRPQLAQTREICHGCVSMPSNSKPPGRKNIFSKSSPLAIKMRLPYFRSFQSLYDVLYYDPQIER